MNTELLKRSNNSGVLRKGCVTRIVEVYGSNRWTLTSLWKDYNRIRRRGVGMLDPDLSNKQRRRRLVI